MNEPMHFPIGIEHFEGVLDAVQTQASEMGIGAEQILRVTLIVEELYANSLHHGRAEGTAFFSLDRTASGLCLTYVDDGPRHDPFAAADRSQRDAPLERRPVGGLGVPLIRELSQQVVYQHIDGHNHITIKLHERSEASNTSR